MIIDLVDSMLLVMADKGLKFPPLREDILSIIKSSNKELHNCTYEKKHNFVLITLEFYNGPDILITRSI